MSSCAACAVPGAPPRADRRHPHVQLRCRSAYHRACSLELTRRRRASAEPRARRSLLAPPTLSSAHRSCRRAPTDAILTFSLLLLCLSPRLFTRTDTTTVSESRDASTSFPVSAADPAGRAPNVSPCTACAVLALFPIRVPRSRHQPRRATARGASHPTDARRSRSHCPPPRAIRSRGAVFLSLWKVALGRACVACLGGAAICQRMRASTDETIPGVFLVL